MKIIAFLFICFCLSFSNLLGQSRLILAIKNKNQEEIERLLQIPDEINKTDENGATPLMWATFFNDLNLVKQLVSKNAILEISGAIIDPQDTSSSYGSILVIVAGKGYFELAKYFIDCLHLNVNTLEWDISSQSFSGWTPLQWASANNQFEMINYLIRNGAELNIQSRLQLMIDSIKYFQNSPNLTKTIEICERIIPIAKTYYSANDTSEYPYILFDVSNIYAQAKNYKKAIYYLTESSNIYLKVEGEYGFNYSMSLGVLGTYYYEIGNSVTSIQLLQKCLAIHRKILEQCNTYSESAIGVLLKIYIETNDQSNLAKLLDSRIECIKKSKGIYSTDFLYYLNLLQNSYYKLDEIEKADSLLKLELNISKQRYLENLDKHEYANFIETIAVSQNKIKAYSNSIKFHKLFFKIIKSDSLCDYKLMATGLHNFAYLYQEIGDFKMADSLYNVSVNIKDKIYGANSPELARSFNALGTLYSGSSLFFKAEPILLKALKIFKDSIENYSDQYCITTNNLGLLYEELGNYKMAFKLYTEAIELLEKNHKTDSTNYFIILNNLGCLYLDMNDFEIGSKLLLKCNSFNRNKYGENSLEYISSLKNIAHLYMLKERYQEANEFYVKTLEIEERVLGKKHKEYASTIYNISCLKYLQGMNDDAISFLKNAIDILKESQGENSPDYIMYINALAFLMDNKGQINVADSLYKIGLNCLLNQIQKQFSFLSLDEQGFYIRKYINSFNNLNEFYFVNSESFHSMSNDLYNIELITKGLLLSSRSALMQSLHETKDSSLIQLFNQWISLKSQIATMYTSPDSSINNYIKTKEIIAKEIEKKLINNFKSVENFTVRFSLRNEDIKKALLPFEAAIEFTSFPFSKNKLQNNSIYYCALILKRNMLVPERVYLFEEKQLFNLIQKKHSDNAQFLEQFYASRGAGLLDSIGNRQNANGSEFYNLIWKPLEPYLDSITTVYFSPSGLLYQVSFAALPIDSTHCLSDQFDLHQLSSTRELVTNRSERKTGNYYLFGGIDYNADSTILIKTNKSNQSLYASRSFTRDTTCTNNQLPYLKGTLVEVEGIQKQLTKQNIPSTIFTGCNASEESFKALNGKSPRVIHIASHGFFYPDLNENPMEDRFMVMGEDRFKYSPNPLLRSGLMFAGANHAWNGEPVNEKLEDGILTAYEISQMDLYGTDLVVLSACETGLGEIRGSEGVFGLQRAFKMAGVQTIIMSLWKVPDTQTAQLMNLFYENWMKGQTKHLAFVNAQKSVRKKYPNPYYWAGFVIVD